MPFPLLNLSSVFTRPITALVNGLSLAEPNVPLVAWLLYPNVIS